MSTLKELGTWFWLGMINFALFIGYSFYNTSHYDIIAGQCWVVSVVCIGVADILKYIELHSLELQEFILEHTVTTLVNEGTNKTDY